MDRPPVFEPQARRGDLTVRLIDDANPDIADQHFIIEQDRARGRRITVASAEDIAEAMLEHIERLLPRVTGHRLAAHVEDLPKIVDAVRMVGMLVGPDHRIERPDACRQQLPAHIGSGIDQNRGRIALDEDRRARTPVAWLVGIARAPIAPDTRHARRRTAAEDDQLHAVAFPNNLKKLRPV
jgi:hypothetical protein